MTRWIALLAVAVLAFACGGADDTGGDGATDGATGAPTDGATEAGTLIGVFGGDSSLEGGCAWIEATGGRDADLGRVEPIWPSGHRVEFTPRLQLLGPDGEVVAGSGDELVLEGAEATGMASKCQIGPLYRVDAILGEVGR